MTDIGFVYERKCIHYEECERVAIPGSDCCAWCQEYDQKIADWMRVRIAAFVSLGYERMASAAGWSDAEMYGLFKGYSSICGLCDYTHKARLVAINASAAAIDYGDGHTARLIRRDSLDRPQG